MGFVRNFNFFPSSCFFIAGAHRRWHPYSAVYLSGVRSGFDVFDHNFSFYLVRRAVWFFRSVPLSSPAASSLFYLGGNPVFKSVNPFFLSLNSYFLVGKYVSGFFTNFYRMRWHSRFSIFKTFPSTVVLLDTVRAYSAVNELNRLSVPFVGLCSSSVNPTFFTYPIPSNYSPLSMKFFLSLFLSAFAQGVATRKVASFHDLFFFPAFQTYTGQRAKYADMKKNKYKFPLVKDYCGDVQSKSLNKNKMSITVPAIYRFKNLRRYRSDSFGTLFNFLRHFKRGDSSALLRRQLSLVKLITASSFRRVLGSRFSLYRSRFRSKLSFLQRYKFPRFMGQRRSRVTHYSQVFSVKQQLKRFYYYFRERQLSAFVKKFSSGTSFNSNFRRVYPDSSVSPVYKRILSSLEFRLSSVLLRSRFFVTSFEVRQAIVHRHVYVNGKCCKSPNQVLGLGDTVSFSSNLKKRIRFNIASFLRVLIWVRNFILNPVMARVKNPGSFKKGVIPFHLDVNFGLLVVSIVAQPRFSTLYFPTNSASVTKFLGFYRK